MDEDDFLFVEGLFVIHWPLYKLNDKVTVMLMILSLILRMNQ